MEASVRTLHALGHTVSPFDSRGDLRRAADVAASGQGVDGEIARHLLAIRCGQPRQALRGLRVLAQTDALSPWERSWVAVFQAYASLLSWHLLPGGSGLLPIQNDCANRGTLLEDLQPLWRLDREHPAGVDAELWPHQLIAGRIMLLMSDISGPMTAAGISFQAFAKNMADRGEAWELPDAMRQRLKILAQAASQTARLVAQQGLAQIAFRLGDQTLAVSLLGDCAEQAAVAGDHLGVAACRLREASWLLAPLGGAEILDFAVADNGAGAVTTSASAEGFEQTRVGADDTAAIGLVHEAEQILRARAAESSDTGCGFGMIGLHRSWLAFRRGDYAGQVGYADAACDAFTAAGDDYGRHLAAVHRIIAGIGSGMLRAGEQQVADIAAWSTRDGSYSWGFGLGLLLARVGRYWQRRSDPQRARQAFLRAEQLFCAVDAARCAAQVLGDLADLNALLGLGHEQLSAYEQAVEMWRRYANSWPNEAPAAHASMMQLILNANQAAIRFGEPSLITRAMRLAEAVHGV